MSLHWTTGEVGWTRHPKVLALAWTAPFEGLPEKAARAAAMGYVAMLRDVVTTCTTGGDLTGKESLIAAGLGCSVTFAQELLTAMVEVELVDETEGRLRVNGWKRLSADPQNALERKRKANRERKRRSRRCHTDVTHRCHTDVTLSPPVATPLDERASMGCHTDVTPMSRVTVTRDGHTDVTRDGHADVTPMSHTDVTPMSQTATTSDDIGSIGCHTDVTRDGHADVTRDHHTTATIPLLPLKEEEKEERKSPPLPLFKREEREEESTPTTPDNNTPRFGELAVPLETSRKLPQITARSGAWRHLVEAWNELAVEVGCPQVRCHPTEADKRKAGVRVREGLLEPDTWKALCTALAASSFHLGDNDRGWRANFTWLCRPGKARDLIGQYEASGSPTPTLTAATRNADMAAELKGWLAEDAENAG